MNYTIIRTDLYKDQEALEAFLQKHGNRDKNIKTMLELEYIKEDEEETNPKVEEKPEDKKKGKKQA